MEFEKWLEKLKKNWMASAGLCICAGLILLLFPRAALDLALYGASAFIILTSAVRVYEYLRSAKAGPALFEGELILGLLGLGLGVFLITNVRSVERVVPILFGVLLIGFAIIGVQRSLEAKEAGNDKWRFILVIAAISCVLGLLILFNPFRALNTMVKIIGASLIYEGVADGLSLKMLGQKLKWVKGE